MNPTNHSILIKLVITLILTISLPAGLMAKPITAQDPGLRKLMAAAPPYRAPATPPQGGVIVQPCTLSTVLMESANKSQNVRLRIVSGALKGSVAEGSFSDNGWVCVAIDRIRTPYGTDVWMPACKCQDAQGSIDIRRVQVDRAEWSRVRNGGVAAAGTTFHLRVLSAIQFDRSSGSLAKN